MPPKPLRIGIQGATGRMGTRLIRLIADDPGLALGAALVRADHPRLGDDAGQVIGAGRLGVALGTGWGGEVDVLVDFSTPDATLGLAEECAGRGVPLVAGTTGFGPEQRRRLEAFAERTAILLAPNTSRAVNLLFRLAGQAAEAFGAAADVEIVERHHRFKKDAPSGTAIRLAEVVAGASGAGPTVHGRHGAVGERPLGEIGMHALRMGDNPGEHTVVFGLMGECLEITHRALNRDGFALGALDAARFLAGKPAGWYTMADVLG